MLAQTIRLGQAYWALYLEGLWGTLWLSAVSVFFATLLGTLLAFMKLSRVEPFRWFVDAWLFILRGTPALLHLYFFWLLLPKVLPLKLSETHCVVVALIVSASAYICEIIRSGIQAVDPGQREAGLSLGLSGFHTLSHIVMPQAVKNILPALGNEFITMMKQTSLASVFFVGELMTAYRSAQAATFLSLPALIIAGFIYLSLTTVLTFLLNRFERRLRRSERTFQPPTRAS